MNICFCREANSNTDERAQWKFAGHERSAARLQVATLEASSLLA
jgi:hypothetical protein